MDSGHIIMIRQGLFFRAYNQGAFILHSVMGYAVKQGTLIGLSTPLFYVGFPAISADKVVSSLSNLGGVVVDQNDRFIEVKQVALNTKYDISAMHILVSPSTKRVKLKDSKKSNCVKKSISQQILSFDTLKATPIESLNFIVYLQNEIKQASTVN